MKKIALLFLLFPIFVIKAQNQNYFRLELTKEYRNKQVNVNAVNSDIYVLESGVLIKKIPKGEHSRILVKGDKGILYSTQIINDEDLSFQGKEMKKTFLDTRNTPIFKLPRIEHLLSIWLLLLIVLLSIIRVRNYEVFYGFLIPWVAYSNTQEVIGKMNARNMLLPISLLGLSSIACVWIFNPYFTGGKLIYISIIVVLIFVVKLLIMRLMEFLFGLRGFAKTHLLEFLKMSIIFSLGIFSVRFLEILNRWDFSMVYRTIFFLYILVWLVRITFVIYKERQQKIIQFFSYICATEAIPAIMLVALWKS